MSDKREKAFPLSVPVVSVFIVANGLIRAPFSEGSLWGLVFAILLGVILLPILLKLLKRIELNGAGVTGKVLLFLLSVLALLPAVSTFEYCEFVYKAVLPHADMWLIVAFFAACVLCLALSDDLALYKFAFLSFALTLAAFSVLFIMSAKTFCFNNLVSAFDFSRFSLSELGEYACKLILPAAAAVLYVRLSSETATAPQIMLGAAAGGVFCIICVFDSVLSFGLPLAQKLEYPYIDDISTVTVGSLFTRMDAFAYFSFFATYILKCAVCVKTSARLISDFR